MPKTYLALAYWQVAIAASLIAIDGAVSLALRLGLEWKLLLAATRTTVQLLLIGFVLQAVFATDHVAIVVSLMAVMTLIAGIAAVRRTNIRFSGVWLNSVFCIWASAWLIAGIGLTAVVQVNPWYRPQYAIPLLGMILGNTLNGMSLGLDRLGSELTTQGAQVEALLALGATRWEAALPPIRQAVRTGMIPILNAMMVAGIVSLPGMMTGQLLSGVAPIEAVKYQIVIMFLVASGTALGTVSIVLLSYLRLFNADHQFLNERIRVGKS